MPRKVNLGKFDQYFTQEELEYKETARGQVDIYKVPTVYIPDLGVVNYICVNCDEECIEAFSTSLHKARLIAIQMREAYADITMDQAIEKLEQLKAGGKG